MQTVTRVGYALFLTEPAMHERYLEKARLLSRLRLSLLSYFRSFDFPFNPSFISASVEYDETKRLSACIYKNTLFFGFIDKASGFISFVDKDNNFPAVDSDVFLHLECRMEHAIKARYNQKAILAEKYVSQAWNESVILLDKIIAFEEKVKTLPEDVQSKFREQLLYDECIDIIIATGTGYCPDLNIEIDARISQAFKIVGRSEPEEHCRGFE